MPARPTRRPPPMKTTLGPLPRQQGIALLLMLLAMACVFGIPAAQAEGVRSADMLAHTCAGCHGTDGASAGAAMPTIGGFEKAYLVNVLTDYKHGLRPATIMDRIMRGYSDQEIAAIASWFAARPWVSTDRPVDGDLAQRGELVHLEHCETCHGDGGRGQDDKSPRLAGQWAPYLRHTLESCRAKGLRCKTRQGAERVLALDEAEIDALVHYYEGQK